MRTDLTPSQKLKWTILQSPCSGESLVGSTVEITAKYIDELFEASKDELEMEEERGAEYETSLRAPYNRNYECCIRAREAPDGSWIAWPYWYGGGKHGCPEAIPWIEDAFEIESWTEIQIVRCFKEKK